MKLVTLGAALAVGAMAFATSAAAQTTTTLITGSSDYPTSARADYVLGCMAANSNTRAALDHCSCSVDVIASILPYDRYEEAETVLSMRQSVGAQAREFTAVKGMNDIIADLRRAQAEAEIRCFR